MDLIWILSFLLLYDFNLVHSKTDREIFDALYQLKYLDDEFCQAGRQLFDMIKKTSKLAKTQKEAYVKNVLLAGSIAEGAAIARIFSKSKDFDSGVNREVEIDIEYVLFQLTDELADHVVNIPNKIGYVKLKSDASLLKNARKLGWRVDDQQINEYLPRLTSPEGWFQPYKLKSIAKEKVELKDPNKLIELLIAAALKTKKKHVDLTPVSNDVTKSSVASDFLLKVRGKNFVKVSIDTVPLVKLSWNPSFLSAWVKQERKWPPKHVVDELGVNGFIIAKPSRDEKMNMESVEMRYAFAHFERRLVQLRTKHQNVIYLTFKIMFTRWIKPIYAEQMSSFIAKTVMFWACERFPPDHKIWQESMDGVRKVLNYLFSELSKAFMKSYLPYYFNGEVNVIEAVPHQKRMEAVAQIDMLLKDLTNYLPFDSHKETEAIHELIKVTRSVTEVLEEFKNKDYSRLLKQPELISDVLQAFIDEIDWRKIGRKIEDELKRFGKNVEKEAKKIGKKIEKETKRFAKKAEKEIKRFAKRIGL